MTLNTRGLSAYRALLGNRAQQQHQHRGSIIQTSNGQGSYTFSLIQEPFRTFQVFFKNLQSWDITANITKHMSNLKYHKTLFHVVSHEITVGWVVHSSSSWSLRQEVTSMIFTDTPGDTSKRSAKLYQSLISPPRYIHVAGVNLVNDCAIRELRCRQTIMTRSRIKALY